MRRAVLCLVVSLSVVGGVRAQTEAGAAIALRHEIALDRRGAVRAAALHADAAWLLTTRGTIELRGWPELARVAAQRLELRTRVHLLDALDSGFASWGVPRTRLDEAVLLAPAGEVITLSAGEVRRHRRMRGTFRGGLSIELPADAVDLRAGPDGGISVVLPNAAPADFPGPQRVWFSAGSRELRREPAAATGPRPQPAAAPPDTPPDPAAVVAVLQRGGDAMVARADGRLQVRRDGRWIERDDLPLEPVDLQFSRDGRALLVTSPSAWQVVDVDTGESRWHPAPCEVRDVVAVLPGRIAGEILLGFEGRVDLYDPLGGRIVVAGLASVPAGHRPVAIDASGERLITTGASAHAIVAVGSGRWTEYPGAALGAVFRPGTSESWVWVQSVTGDAEALERRDGAGELLESMPLAIETLLGSAVAPSATPPWLAVAGSAQRVVLRRDLGGFSMAAGAEHASVEAASGDFGAFLPGSRDLLVAAGRDALTLVDAASGETLGTSPREPTDRGWVLAPDGRHVASIRDRDAVAVLRIHALAPR